MSKTIWQNRISGKTTMLPVCGKDSNGSNGFGDDEKIERVRLTG